MEYKFTDTNVNTIVTNDVYRKHLLDFKFDRNDFTVSSFNNNILKAHNSDVVKVSKGDNDFNKEGILRICAVGDVNIVCEKNNLLQAISSDVVKIKELLNNWHPKENHHVMFL